MRDLGHEYTEALRAASRVIRKARPRPLAAEAETIIRTEFTVRGLSPSEEAMVAFVRALTARPRLMPWRR
jgi:hypothetical protein